MKTTVAIFTVLASLLLCQSALAQSGTQKTRPAEVEKHPLPVWVDKPSSSTKLNLKDYSGKQVFAGFREFQLKECEEADHQFSRYYKCKTRIVQEPLKVEWLFSVPHTSINTGTGAANMTLSTGNAPPPKPSHRKRRK